MLWKKYGEDMVLAAGRYNQIKVKHIMPHGLLTKDLVGYVNMGTHWIVYREEKDLYRTFFAKNGLWFSALVSEPEFTVVRELPQIYLV